ncbi:metaxin 1 [Geranomyces variabilis]|uniref:Metaxin 1 n=1 Tax=Geranomyces variabilis TaxID=109894 RepID=A0AAD5TH28_9FUNG|nr:metaxin 1 [Geranomyces variabilis]
MSALDNPGDAAAFELFTWGPAYNLPSFDPFCLASIAYLQWSEVRWMVNECNNAAVSPRGELPMLRDGLLEPVVGTAKIIAHLKKKGHDLDQHLSATQVAECLAYTSLVEEKLYEALLFSWWLEAQNVMKSTRPTIAKSLRGWAGMRIPTQLQQKAEARLKKYRKVAYKGKETNEIYVLAREWYAALANKLGNQQYFFGDRPSSLDAVVFGHLALHCIPSLAEPTLFSILTFEFPTLHAYCDRLRTELFTAPLRQSPNHRPSYILTDMLRSPLTYARSLLDKLSGSVTVPAKEMKPKERRDQLVTIGSTVGAIAVFLGYVFYNGIVEIDTGEWQDGEKHNEE